MQPDAAGGIAGLFRLDRQVALVTGAGAGIGRAIAEILGAAGAAVVALDRDRSSAERTARDIADSGGECLPIAVDVTDGKAVEDAFHAAVTHHGRLDILVNNAGIYPPFTRMPEVDWQTYIRTMDVNVHAVMRNCVLAASAMAPGGRIINISSIESLRPSGAGASHYGVSKAAVNAITRAAAVDLAPLGIRVNAVLPGVVRTEGTGALPEEAFAAFAARVPCGRIAMPSDVAGAVLFLASAAALYVNGHCLVVDGGMTIAG